MSLYGSPQWMYKSGEDYNIPYSCRFDNASDSYLSRTTTSTGSDYIATLSAWVKRGNVGVRHTIFAGWESSSERMNCYFLDDCLTMQIFTGGTAHDLKTNEVFRDPSAWYHVVFQFNTSSGTESERFKMFVNGAQITSFSVDDTIGQNIEMKMWGSTSQITYVGAMKGSAVENEFDGYMAEVNVIDGTVVAPSSFGETDATYGHWKPKEYTGSHGTNGFYLDFADSGALGDDESANTNDYTATNLAATDQMIDTPTNNFAVMNVLTNNFLTTVKEGALKVATTAIDKTIWSTLGVTSGKWYAEVEIVAAGTESHYTGSGVWGSPIGVSDGEGNSFESYYNSAVMRTGTGVVTIGSITWGSGTKNSNSTGGAGFAGSIFTIAFDADIGSVWFAKNAAPDTSATAQVTGLTTSPRRDYRFGQQEANTNPGWTMTWNFGQDSSFAGEKTAQGNQDGNDIGDFYYTPPTNFLALCTSNLPDTITPSEHFNTVLWTGNATQRNITGVGFQPDLVWGKNRAYGNWHEINDAVRGVTKSVFSNDAGAEGTDNTKLMAFLSDGFQIGAAQGFNKDGDAHVAWNWKANGSGSSNTNGSINTTSTSANQDAGFSISTYAGTGSTATVGHGLSKAPEAILVKNRDVADHWLVYHHGNTTAGETERLILNTVNATDDDSVYWNDTAPTSTVFTVGTHHSVNASTENYVAYCFHSVEGYSKMGFYTGNEAGAEHKPFVHTGFRPAFIIVKITSSTDNWYIHDIERETSNEAKTIIKADDAGAESTSAGYAIDILSNGFKNRGTDTSHNDDGQNYVYMAFAETPFKYANAR